VGPPGLRTTFFVWVEAQLKRKKMEKKHSAAQGKFLKKRERFCQKRGILLFIPTIPFNMKKTA
jgi:hypothetical protein